LGIKFDNFLIPGHFLINIMLYLLMIFTIYNSIEEPFNNPITGNIMVN